MQITIPVKELQAVALFSAEGDVRYYLNCVAIVNDQLCATDGHKIFQITLSESIDTEVLIPIDMIKVFLKGLSAADKRNADMTIYYGNIHSLRCGNIEVMYRPIDAQYPDINSIIPSTKKAVDEISFNWDYLALFAKASKILGNKMGHSPITLYDNGCAKVSIAYEHIVTGLCTPTKI
jgi:DNA polymerase III sliding clamp (beta) subunit (PCNA family)